MDKQVSVIIPVKNGQEVIENCLIGIFSQSMMPYEVIVVDGNSIDNTTSIAKKYPVKLLTEFYGTVGGARHIGLINSQGTYVAFTDADCIPEKTWLENLLKGFSAGIVGVGGGTQNIGNGLWEKSIAYALDTYLGSANSVQDRVFKKKKTVNSISGCNSMYFKKILIKLGGFNVHMSVNEDTELCTRLKRLGDLVYVPDAIVFHNQKRNLFSFIKRMHLFGYGRGVNKLWDVQVFPPILAFIVFLLYFISPNLFLSFISIYLTIIIYFTINIFLKAQDLRFLISVPLIFIIEHISYTMGFFQGVSKSLFLIPVLKILKR